MENTAIDKINLNGEIFFDGNKKRYDKVINIAGPWASKILEDNNISSTYKLDLIRGSHIIINRRSGNGFFLEVPNERRIFFVLPYNKKTLIGTTEERQTIGEQIKPSKKEIIYLINAYNAHFVKPISEKSLQHTLQQLGRLNRVHLQQQQTEKITYQLAGTVRSIKIENVFYFYAQEKYTKVVFDGGEALIEDSLKQLEMQYPRHL